MWHSHFVKFLEVWWSAELKGVYDRSVREKICALITFSLSSKLIMEAPNVMRKTIAYSIWIYWSFIKCVFHILES